jgi:hypothetical protein
MSEVGFPSYSPDSSEAEAQDTSNEHEQSEQIQASVTTDVRLQSMVDAIQEPVSCSGTVTVDAGMGVLYYDCEGGGSKKCAIISIRSRLFLSRFAIESTSSLRPLPS